MIKPHIKYLAFAVGIAGSLLGCAYCSAMIMTWLGIHLALNLNTQCKGLCDAQPDGSYA